MSWQIELHIQALPFLTWILNNDIGERRKRHSDVLDSLCAQIQSSLRLDELQQLQDELLRVLLDIGIRDKIRIFY